MAIWANLKNRLSDRILGLCRRDLEAGVETSGRREREARRKRKLREYDDEDYEEPLRIRFNSACQLAKAVAASNPGPSMT